MGSANDISLDQRQSLYSGGDGSTFDNAVVINAEITSIGIPAEYQYISKIYGQWKLAWTLIDQSFFIHEHKYYDVLHIKLSDGVEKYIYFDITQFYGKF